jgi:hypothetical protein
MAGYGYGISVSGSRTPVVASSTPAPSGISLTAPTIYVSGLTFEDGGSFYAGVLYSPYTLYTTGYWRDVYEIGFVTSSGGMWFFYTFANYEGSPTAALVATNTAPSTSLPTTGWVNSQNDLAVSGTLVISTTP